MLYGALSRSVRCQSRLMRENKIRAMHQRCTIVLRAKRQYVVVPYAF